MRTQHGGVPDVDMRIVDKGAAEIAVDSLSEMQMRSTHIGVERRLDVAVITDFSEHFFEHGGSLFLFGRTGPVEIVQAVEPFQLIVHDSRIIG